MNDVVGIADDNIMAVESIPFLHRFFGYDHESFAFSLYLHGYAGFEHRIEIVIEILPESGGANFAHAIKIE